MEPITNEINQEINLTFGEKLKYFFIKPGKVFAQFLEKPKYLGNMLVLAVITCITSVMGSIAAKGVMDEILDKQTQGLDPAAAQMSKGIANVMTSPAVAVIGGLVGLVVGIYVSSAIYFGLAKLFKGEGTYTQMVAVYVLAHYPLVIGKFISTVYSVAVKKTIADPNKAVGFGDVIINALNVFGIWRMVIFAIGISVVFKISKKKSATIVILIWAIGLIFSLISVGFAQAMQNIVPAQ
ncbi:YIP1 family protein [Clostridium sp. SYSU_GA19001]|uniref:Yip1 family protein n=1 Tax=Clostridium caldaquaticum TaxID=2940653 RepID=UPI002077537B|nr:Yip1 family protein [Clostridium caldaquaticum]MCM8709543.1 YIP1 family protein [Clostridium caldaquaticum]